MQGRTAFQSAKAVPHSAFSAATRETGGELHLMGKMGYDATTFGNHDFDLGPDGLGKSIIACYASAKGGSVSTSVEHGSTDKY